MEGPSAIGAAGRMPITAPMTDGPSIQAAGARAVKPGMTLIRVLALVSAFRETDDATPPILMCYYNPVYVYGVDAFLSDARSAGVDGLIIVDLPPEEDAERGQAELGILFGRQIDDNQAIDPGRSCVAEEGVDAIDINGVVVAHQDGRRRVIRFAEGAHKGEHPYQRHARFDGARARRLDGGAIRHGSGDRHAARRPDGGWPLHPGGGRCGSSWRASSTTGRGGERLA